VSQESHRVDVRFDFDRELLFNARESLISEIERHSDDGRSVRASPFIAEIDWRVEVQSFFVELRVQTLDILLHERAFDREAELGYSSIEERSAFAFPVARR
jgi:hypothetical protein